MKTLKLITLSVVMMMCLVIFVQAQTIQITGSMEGWNTNSPSWNMYNTNTGVWTLTTTLPTAGEYDWKLDAGGASWSPEWPTGWNSWVLTTTANQTVTFYFSQLADNTWSPSSSLLWNTANINTTNYMAEGFLTWLGASNDTNLNFPAAVMQPAGNGIYTTMVIFSTINPATTGFKSFWVNMNGPGATQEQIGAGQAYGGNWGFIDALVGGPGLPNALPLSAFYQNDTITLWADTIHGRLKVTHTNGPTVGPPWYAIGDVGGSQYTNANANTLMTTSNGTIYTLNVVATYSSVTHFINVVDQLANRHPISSANQGTYFSLTSGQTITVTYDASTHLDGWLPFTNFVYSSNTADRGPHQYNVVGTFSNFGFTDWDLTNANLIMNDTTVYSGGNPNIYTWVGVATNTANLAWKVALDANWWGQIGTDGASLNGNPPNNSLQIYTHDTVLLKADVYHGRFIAQNLTHNVLPSPIITPSNGKPGTVGVLSASGGTPPYIGWVSSNPTEVTITGFSGSQANVSFGATYGSSTITVYDSLGQTGTAVASVVPTSAPLAPESAVSYENRNTTLWSINE